MDEHERYDMYDMLRDAAICYDMMAARGKEDCIDRLKKSMSIRSIHSSSCPFMPFIPFVPFVPFVPNFQC